MQETWVQSLGWDDPLEMEKAIHSSILPWRIPWTVQSVGSQRVGHDWATFTFLKFKKDFCAIWASWQPCKRDIAWFPSFNRWKKRPRERKWLAQGHGRCSARLRVYGAALETPHLERSIGSICLFAEDTYNTFQGKPRDWNLRSGT